MATGSVAPTTLAAMAVDVEYVSVLFCILISKFRDHGVYFNFKVVKCVLNSLLSR